MKIDGEKLREIAVQLEVTIDELARTADLNPQTLYRTKGHKALGPKSTRNLLKAVEELTERKKIRSKAVG
jgi:predicted transcriptional regulator